MIPGPSPTIMADKKSKKHVQEAVRVEEAYAKVSSATTVPKPM